jgi:hypothetical protein
MGQPISKKSKTFTIKEVEKKLEKVPPSPFFLFLFLSFPFFLFTVFLANSWKNSSLKT